MLYVSVTTISWSLLLYFASFDFINILFSNEIFFSIKTNFPKDVECIKKFTMKFCKIETMQSRKFVCKQLKIFPNCWPILQNTSESILGIFRLFFRTNTYFGSKLLNKFDWSVVSQYTWMNRSSNFCRSKETRYIYWFFEWGFKTR